MIARIAFAVTLFAGAVLADMSINTPASLIECQPAALSWSGGTADYILAVIPGEDVSSAALETLASDLSDTSYTWTANLASGTYITLKLTDSTGAIAYSSAVTIQAGTDSSCVNSTATTAVASSAATTTSEESAATAIVSGTTASVSSAVSAASAGVAAISTSASGSASSGTSRSSSTVRSSSTAATALAASAAASSGAATLPSTVQLPALLLSIAGGIAALF